MPGPTPSSATSRSRSASGRTSALTPSSTAGERSSSGSRAASSPPTPCPVEDIAARAAAGARDERSRARRAAPRHPVQRAHRRRPARHDRGPGRRRVLAHRRGPGRLRRPGHGRLRRLVRGGRADRRPPARSVPPRRRPPQPATAADRGRRRRRRRDDPRTRAVRDPAHAPLLRAARGHPRRDPPDRHAHLLPVQGRGVVLDRRRRRAPAQGPRLDLRGAAAGRGRDRRPGGVLERAGRRLHRRRAAGPPRRPDRGGDDRRVRRR